LIFRQSQNARSSILMSKKWYQKLQSSFHMMIFNKGNFECAQINHVTLYKIYQLSRKIDLQLSWHICRSLLAKFNN